MTDATPEKPAPRNGNRFDSTDIVRREMVTLVGGLKFAAYRVRDMAAERFGREEFSNLQYHLTYVPTTSLGRLGSDVHETQLVSEGGATIYAMLEEFQVAVLRDALALIKDDETFTAGAYGSTDGDCWIEAYRHPETQKVELQIGQGTQILGVLGLSAAQMFVMLAKRVNQGWDAENG